MSNTTTAAAESAAGTGADELPDEAAATGADTPDDDAAMALKYGWEAGDVDVATGDGEADTEGDTGGAKAFGLPDAAIADALLVIAEVKRRLEADGFDAKNCGTGAGGFKPGNRCGGGGRGDGGRLGHIPPGSREVGGDFVRVGDSVYDAVEVRALQDKASAAGRKATPAEDWAFTFRTPAPASARETDYAEAIAWGGDALVRRVIAPKVAERRDGQATEHAVAGLTHAVTRPAKKGGWVSETDPGMSTLQRKRFDDEASALAHSRAHVDRQASRDTLRRATIVPGDGLDRYIDAEKPTGYPADRYTVRHHVVIPEEYSHEDGSNLVEKGLRLIADAKNCGTGAGGFHMGNHCAAGGGGKPSGGHEPPGKDFGAEPGATPRDITKYQKAMAAAHAAPFTDREKVELKDYTNTAHATINDYLRTGDAQGKPTTGIDAKIAAIDGAIAKAGLAEPAKVYHAVHDVRALGFDPKNPSSIVGKTLHEPGYLTTSLNPAMARRAQQHDMHGAVIRIAAPKGAKGASLHGVSRNPGGAEVLFARGSRYKVTGVSKHPDGTTILHAELL